MWGQNGAATTTSDLCGHWKSLFLVGGRRGRRPSSRAEVSSEHPERTGGATTSTRRRLRSVRTSSGRSRHPGSPARLAVDGAAGRARVSCGPNAPWTAEPGTAGAFVVPLRAWPMLRFEITEEPSPGVDGERFCYVPGLGLWQSRTCANGDIVVGEDQLRARWPRNSRGRRGVRAPCRMSCSAAPWDEALEPFRRAARRPVTWLHRVG